MLLSPCPCVQVIAPGGPRHRSGRPACPDRDASAEKDAYCLAPALQFPRRRASHTAAVGLAAGQGSVRMDQTGPTTSGTARAEWAAAWPLPFVGMLGLSAGSMFNFSAGVLMADMTHASAGRAPVLARPEPGIWLLLGLAPVIGWIIQRIGPPGRASTASGCSRSASRPWPSPAARSGSGCCSAWWPGLGSTASRRRSG